MASPASGASAQDSTLFLRKATGLVRSWSVFDAFVYAFFSINLVTLGMYSFSQMYYFEGGLLPTLLVSAFFLIFEIIVYASLISVMPRAGGDYVWQSRILGGGIGFVLAVTGWWFILWLWVPLYSDMLRNIFFTPLLGILGLQEPALWFSQTDVAFFVTIVIMLAFVTFFIAKGMKWYSRFQKLCWYVSIGGLAVVLLFLLLGNNEAFRTGLEREATTMFGAQPGVYEATLVAGEEAGAIAPLMGGGMVAIFLAMGYIVFFNLWPNWGATLYGEVRGATDFKRNFGGMAWALLATTLLAVVLFLLIEKTITWKWFMAANGAWWNYSWGLHRCRPAAAYLALSRAAGRLHDPEPDHPVHRDPGDERLVVRLGGHRVPQLDARDLRGRVRPPAAREGRRGRAAHPHADLRPAADGDPVASDRRAFCLQRLQLPDADALLDPGHRRHLPGLDHRRDPAAVHQEGPVRGVADRQVQDPRHPADQHRRGDLRRLPVLPALSVDHRPECALRHRR